MPSEFTFLAPRHDYAFDSGWSRKVEVGGVAYVVGVERGKPVRIAFKPRGQNRGYRWCGFVRTDKREVWSGEVVKSLGVRGLLRAARLIKTPAAPPSRLLTITEFFQTFYAEDQQYADQFKKGHWEDLHTGVEWRRLYFQHD